MNSCSSNVQPKPSEVLPQIKVNGVLINEDSLAKELQYHQHPDFDTVVQQSGQTLVIRHLLLEQATLKNLDISNDNEEESLQKLMAEEVIYDDPTEDDCLRYFNNNPGKFTSIPLLEVDHILLAAAKDDLASRELAKTKAKELIELLKENPGLFPELAERYSACPSKKTAGSLGQISKGQTVPEFERQLLVLPKGLAKKSIESRYGFHVVNISRKIEGVPLEYPMVAEKIRGYLTHRSSLLAIQAYIQGLVEQAEIEGVNIRFLEDNIHIHQH